MLSVSVALPWSPGGRNAPSPLVPSQAGGCLTHTGVLVSPEAGLTAAVVAAWRVDTDVPQLPPALLLERALVHI